MLGGKADRQLLAERIKYERATTQLLKGGLAINPEHLSHQGAGTPGTPQSYTAMRSYGRKPFSAAAYTL